MADRAKLLIEVINPNSEEDTRTVLQKLIVAKLLMKSEGRTSCDIQR